jgi:hypothetical protein
VYRKEETDERERKTVRKGKNKQRKEDGDEERKYERKI